MQKFNKINEPDYNFLDVKIENGRTILYLHHKSCNNDFQIEQYNFFKIGQRCGFCRAKRISDTKTISNDEFNKRIYELVKDEYYVISKYSGRHKAVKFIHTECGHEFDMDAGNFLQGQRCPQCAWDIRSEKLAFSQEEFLERCYSQNKQIEILGAYKNLITKIKARCTICNHIWYPQPSHLIHGIPTGCPKCASSKGEKKISDMLNAYGINYISQYRIKDCRNILPLPFDFAVFNKHDGLLFLLEYDGMQHFKKISFGSKNKDAASINFAKTQINDNIKNQYCADNNIVLIRIPYWEFDNVGCILLKHLSVFYDELVGCE